MKLKIIGMEWLEPFEVASDETAVAYLAALVIDVAVGTSRTVDTIGFLARKVDDFLEVQPIDRDKYVEALQAIGLVDIARQVQEIQRGLAPLVNCGAFEAPEVIPLSPSVASRGGDA